MMDLLTTVAVVTAFNGNAVDLIRLVQEERGSDGPVSRGAQALAGWLLDHQGEMVPMRLFLLPGEDGLTRILAGEMEPSDALASYIAAQTNGVVTPEMFAEPVELPDAAVPAAEGRGADPAPNTGRPLDTTVRVSSYQGRVQIYTDDWRQALSRSDALALHARLGRFLAPAPTAAARG